jgi:hypothetical protein
LQDKEFGKIQLFVGHENPPAAVSTSVQQYKEFSLESAYLGKNFFWGLVTVTCKLTQHDLPRRCKWK